MSAYSNTTQFCPTKAHANADMLSWLPLAAKANITNPVDTHVINMRQTDTLPVHASEVTRRDPILSKAMKFIKQGWPHKVSEAIVPYWRKQNELAIKANCIVWGIHIVIPTKQQE